MSDSALPCLQSQYSNRARSGRQSRCWWRMSLSVARTLAVLATNWLGERQHGGWNLTLAVGCIWSVGRSMEIPFPIQYIQISRPIIFLYWRFTAGHYFSTLWLVTPMIHFKSPWYKYVLNIQGLQAKWLMFRLSLRWVCYMFEMRLQSDWDELGMCLDTFSFYSMRENKSKPKHSKRKKHVLCSISWKLWHYIPHLLISFTNWCRKQSSKVCVHQP